MAVLATSSDVQDVMQDTTIDTDYIDNVLTTVDLVLTEIYRYSIVNISSDLLTELQKYYAAHIIASTTSRMGLEEKVGDASIRYIGQFTVGLDSTPYGQMVKLIDPSGLIANSGKMAASIRAIKSFE